MKRFVWLIKIAISFGLLWFVYHFIDYKQLGKLISQISWSTVLLLSLVYLAGQLLSSFKWWLILRAAGSQLRWPPVMRAYLFGGFVNSYGLGVIGGDFARGILVGGSGLSRSQSFASVVADRAHGLSVLSLLALVALSAVTMKADSSWIVAVLFCVVLAGIFGWVYGPKLLLFVARYVPKLTGPAQAIGAAFPRQPKLIVLITVISLVFHLSQIGVFCLALNVLNLSVPFSDVLAYVPVINILATLPLSWNGLGVRENANVFFFGAYISREQATLVGALWLVAVLVCAAVGGILGVLGQELKMVRKESQKESASEPHSPGRKSSLCENHQR